jgi:hypothetical protein
MQVRLYGAFPHKQLAAGSCKACSPIAVRNLPAHNPWDVLDGVRRVYVCHFFDCPVGTGKTVETFTGQAEEMRSGLSIFLFCFFLHLSKKVLNLDMLAKNGKDLAKKRTGKLKEDTSRNNMQIFIKPVTEKNPYGRFESHYR